MVINCQKCFLGPIGGKYVPDMLSRMQDVMLGTEVAGHPEALGAGRSAGKFTCAADWSEGASAAGGGGEGSKSSLHARVGRRMNRDALDLV